MSTATLKQARMEFKTTEEAKQLIAAAAALSGQDVSAFAMGTLMTRAREVLGAHAVIRLSQEGNRKLAELLAKPPEPTQAMRDLGALPDFPTRAGA